MPNLGIGELVVILMLAILVFGAARLPKIGEDLGKTIRSFKRGLAGEDKIKITAEDKPLPPKPGDRSSGG